MRVLVLVVLRGEGRGRRVEDRLMVLRENEGVGEILGHSKVLFRRGGS